MNSNKLTARIVGVLFITATVTPILTFFFLESLDTPDYLVNVSANETQVLIGMLLELIWALAVVGIPNFEKEIPCFLFSPCPLRVLDCQLR